MSAVIGGQLEQILCGSDLRTKVALTTFVLLLSAVFLFVNLGTYALWDDEAETALLAQGVLATGDTSAVVGHNLNARRGGINLKDLAERLTPPLPTYVMAASFALGAENAFWARLPFAIGGMIAVGIMLVLLWKNQGSNWNFLIFAIALMGNVPFFLYFRNARYYGGVILLVVAILAVYVQGVGSLRRKVVLSSLGALLLLCHPIAFMQIAAVLALDWLIFNRKELPNFRSLAALLAPFLLLAAPVVSIWNPMAVKSSGEYLSQMTFFDRLTLLWWNARDLFRAEFMPLLSLIYVPLAFYRTRSPWLLRGTLAVAVMIVVTSVVSYQAVELTSVADVRYVIGIIPIGMGLGVLSFAAVPEKARMVGLVGAVAIFVTNLGSGKFNGRGDLDSTLFHFIREVARPIQEPYTAAAQWLRQNARAGATVVVAPDFMMYPLMFHAPDQVYAWQLADPADPQFSGLDAIHFRGKIPPDYILAFGPTKQSVEEAISSWRSIGLEYKKTAELPVFWKETYRPEIFWRSFATVEEFDPAAEGIYVYERIES
jgi:hypothetical protein